MAEHLFKLKKGGKTVGYLKIKKGNTYYRYTKGGWTCWRLDFDTAHPFVTKDKNGKDVFAGDCCYSGNMKGYIRWSNAELAWIYEWDDKRGDTHSVLLSRLSAIELIEDKENDRKRKIFRHSNRMVCDSNFLNFCDWFSYGRYESSEPLKGDRYE